MEPLEQLAEMTAASEEPVLDADDLAALLAGAQRGGRTNLNAAAGQGWRWKAGRVATSSSSSNLDGDRDPDTYKYLNCVRQAEFYEALAWWRWGTEEEDASPRRFGTIRLTTPLGE